MYIFRCVVSVYVLSSSSSYHVWICVKTRTSAFDNINLDFRGGKCDDYCCSQKERKNKPSKKARKKNSATYTH